MAGRNVVEKVRVFIAADPEQLIPRKVLEHSIIRHTETLVEFVPLERGRHILRRWTVAEEAGWTGMAIFADVSVLLFRDIWQLWGMPHRTNHKTGTSVWCPMASDCAMTDLMVVDCAAAWKQPYWHAEDRYRYLGEHADDMHALLSLVCGDWMVPPAVDIGREWLADSPKGAAGYKYGRKELPWLHPGSQHARLWQEALIVATSVNYITPEEMEAAVRAGHLYSDYDRYVDRPKENKYRGYHKRPKDVA